MLKPIRVYNGPGSCHTGTSILIDAFKRHVALPVSGINDVEMKTSRDWLTHTSFLCFGGKSAGTFKATLGTEVLERIKTAIYKGTFHYIGICAGAAFAATQIKYRMREDERNYRLENTGLGLFDGLAHGPIRNITERPFVGDTQDLKLIEIYDPTAQTQSKAIYIGGPGLYPLNRQSARHVTPLSYLQGTNVPLSVTLRHGDGRVTLCSYHPEMSAENIYRWALPAAPNAQETHRLQQLLKELDGKSFERFLVSAGIPQTQNPGHIPTPAT